MIKNLIAYTVTKTLIMAGNAFGAVTLHIVLLARLFQNNLFKASMISNERNVDFHGNTDQPIAL